MWIVFTFFSCLCFSLYILELLQPEIHFLKIENNHLLSFFEEILMPCLKKKVFTYFIISLLFSPPFYFFSWQSHAAVLSCPTYHINMTHHRTCLQHKLTDDQPLLSLLKYLPVAMSTGHVTIRMQLLQSLPHLASV